MEEKLSAKAGIQILKPINKVFGSIIDPNEITQYFLSKSTGRMEIGAVLDWEFPEFDGTFHVTIKEVIPNSKISFVWDPETLVTINLTETKDGHTVIKVDETGKENNESGRKWMRENTEGWANFLACMKAWLEYGIHLRKGAFDYMKT